jgi:hypothetical protein
MRHIIGFVVSGKVSNPLATLVDDGLRGVMSAGCPTLKMHRVFGLTGKPDDSLLVL